MKGGVPPETVHSFIREYYWMMHKHLNEDFGLPPMMVEESGHRGTLWKALNIAADSLISGFLRELGRIEANNAGILGYDASDCILHIVISQTPDSITFLYGNLFTIVKLGCACRKLCLNYHIWDGISVFTHNSVVPESILGLVNVLQEYYEIDCINIMKYGQALTYNFQPSDIILSSDILEGIGKTALGLKGIVPTPLGGVL